MSKGRPRRELAFSVVQTPRDLDYVPAPTRDPEEVAFLREQRPGYVIIRNQRVGSFVLQHAFQRGRDTLPADDVDQLADLTSMVAFGTAYHLFAQNDSDRVGERRIKLPVVQNSSTGSRLTRDELMNQTESWMYSASTQAYSVEARHKEGLRTEEMSHGLGRSLANVGVNAAVVAARVSQKRGDDELMQWFTWQAAQGSMNRMMEFSGRLGTRPTVAQLADEHSPLNRFLHDNPGHVSGRVYNLIQEEAEEARARV